MYTLKRRRLTGDADSIGLKDTARHYIIQWVFNIIKFFIYTLFFLFSVIVLFTLYATNYGDIKVFIICTIFTLPSWSGAKYCNLSVCLSDVCLSAQIFKTNTFKLHEIFCKGYLRPWLGLSRTTTQCVMYFRFVEFRISGVFHIFT